MKKIVTICFIVLTFILMDKVYAEESTIESSKIEIFVDDSNGFVTIKEIFKTGQLTETQFSYRIPHDYIVEGNVEDINYDKEDGIRIVKFKLESNKEYNLSHTYPLYDTKKFDYTFYKISDLEGMPLNYKNLEIRIRIKSSTTESLIKKNLICNNKNITIEYENDEAVIKYSSKYGEHLNINFNANINEVKGPIIYNTPKVKEDRNAFLARLLYLYPFIIFMIFVINVLIGIPINDRKRRILQKDSPQYIKYKEWFEKRESDDFSDNCFYTYRIGFIFTFLIIVIAIITLHIDFKDSGALLITGFLSFTYPAFIIQYYYVRKSRKYLKALKYGEAITIENYNVKKYNDKFKKTSNYIIETTIENEKGIPTKYIGKGKYAENKELSNEVFLLRYKKKYYLDFVPKTKRDLE